MFDVRAPAWRYAVRMLAAPLLATLLVGCGSLGPTSVQRDRIDYASVLATTWKEQTLLNIVKLRYHDVPVYLDVSSIISSSSFESQITLGFDWEARNTQSLGGYGRYTDRPTISYAPISGEKFARYLLRPIAPAAVVAFLQAGYPVDRVLQLTTRAVNGVFNRSTASGRAREAEPDFYRLLEAMRRIQISEAIDSRIERRGADEVVLLIFHADDESKLTADLAAVRQILRLQPGTPQWRLSFGSVPQRDNEIAMLTRSMAEIFLEIAGTLEAPRGTWRRAGPRPRRRPPPGRPSGTSPWCASTPVPRGRTMPTLPCATAITGSGSTTTT